MITPSVISRNKYHGNVNVVSTAYLLTTFLKIGAVSFGGHMALLAMAQRQIVDRDKAADADLFTRAISMASLLPGPMAVNAITYIGYTLNHKRGALFSLLGVLLPACLIMTAISWLYFDYGQIIPMQDVLVLVTGVVCGVITAVGYGLYKKEIHESTTKRVVLAGIFLVTCAFSNYWLVILLIITGLGFGALTYCHQGKPLEKENISTPSPMKFSWFIKFWLAVLFVIQLSFVFDVQSWFANEYAKLAVVFSGMSLSLFGGGYVMVPVMQALFVGKLQWLSSQEFVDAIALSQMTPGPILVSATFIGYKIGGLLGALLATVCVFGPPAILITVVSRILNAAQNQVILKNALDGAKVVVTGLIFSSVFRLIESSQFSSISILVAIISTFLIVRYKVSPVYLVLVALCIGVIKVNYL
jgi:chromate transporter